VEPPIVLNSTLYVTDNDKHSSLFCYSKNYDNKMFYGTDTRSQSHKTFFGVMHSSVFGKLDHFVNVNNIVPV